MINDAYCGNVKLRFEYWPLTWFWPLSLVLMQLTFVDVADFPLTLGVFACHLLQIYLLVFYWINRPSNWQIAVALVAFLYSLAVATLSLTTGDAPVDPVQYWRSLAQIVNLILMVLICLNARIHGGREIRRSLTVFCVLASAAALVVIAQAVSFNLLHDFRLAKVLGPLSPSGPGGQVYVPFRHAELPRANGLYSEPSVAGWFMTFVVAIALGVRRHHPFLGMVTAALGSLAAMATLSLTGIIGAVIVLVSYTALVRDGWAFKALWSILAGTGVATAVYYAHEMGILARFAHIDSPGTSIYFRLTAPYRLIGESLEYFPLGYPLGQTEFIASRHYYINWDLGSQTNIDNTLLMIVFYFGIAGILFNLTYVLKALHYLMIRRHAVGLFMTSLLVALCTTGAGWAHHFVLLIGYAIIVGRYLVSEGRAAASVAPRPAPPLIPLRSAAPPARARARGVRSRALWQPADGVA